MAKANSRARWVGIGLTVIVILATVITTFLGAKADIKAVDLKADYITEDVTLLKKEGCLPARETDKSIGVIITRIDSIDNRFDSMQREQRAGFKEILKRLPGE